MKDEKGRIEKKRDESREIHTTKSRRKKLNFFPF